MYLALDLCFGATWAADAAAAADCKRRYLRKYNKRKYKMVELLVVVAPAILLRIQFSRTAESHIASHIELLDSSSSSL